VPLIGIDLFWSKMFRQKRPAVRRTEVLQLWGKGFG
jgi:hypothetical protein